MAGTPRERCCWVPVCVSAVVDDVGDAGDGWLGDGCDWRCRDGEYPGVGGGGCAMGRPCAGCGVAWERSLEDDESRDGRRLGDSRNSRAGINVRVVNG